MAIPNLPNIDWSVLTCCCGNAQHVPEALRALCSTDQYVVEQAYGNLENHVVAQADLYTSAEPIPSIIVDLWPHVQHKAVLLNLLFLIGSAGSSDNGVLYAHCREGALTTYRTLLEREPVSSPWRKMLEVDYSELCGVSD